MDRFCYRCGKLLERPIAPGKTTSGNADYILAEDTKVDELREVLFALKHTPETLTKIGKAEIRDSEYQKVEISSIVEAKDAVKIITEVKLVSIQKTGLICPECYKETDTVIWGVHKNVH